ncbi:GNAT family N-acetyltransferase [Acidovorax sp. NCPPB 3859]|nr:MULTISPECIES: GNAT family N-acetyltransferase [unclassified Acidovorax]MDA8452048.1 GNAT family N-acetyltransferase [Acidovorax sp. GBBC 3297]MDA8461494.1 GNAT family N-acetyltransferase [Acidovorax sp. GBBC 3333]MDA8466509.1 GNAT family N-acetyltransferase [Acidovorax sp. GBBC 3332]MDA8471545.1 GNAT family N-acetyltransferase [Acidovorax sp. GBBC 3299]WCM76460.1 GNAT family N-acetyltransferase [Acidovorax sp. GBBC 712]
MHPELAVFSHMHVEGAWKLSREMSWPYRLEDWRFALGQGQGFVLQCGQEVMGTAAWWAYGETHACAGMVIVARAAQGHGYGARLMDALLAAARPRTITLNSTAEGLALYERRGFVRTGEIGQYQGIPLSTPEIPPGTPVRPMQPTDFAEVARLDHAATGWHRPDMLRALMQVADGHVLEHGGQACGYALSRPFGRGHVIGPVVAAGAADARALVEAALARLGRVFVRIETPLALQLGNWLDAIGLPRVGGATTMVLGPREPAAGPEQLFALANQSFH